LLSLELESIEVENQKIIASKASRNISPTFGAKEVSAEELCDRINYIRNNVYQIDQTVLNKHISKIEELFNTKLAKYASVINLLKSLGAAHLR
jgi:hypothetical protein